MSTGNQTILNLIKADHRGILRLYKQLEETSDKDQRQKVLNTLIREIAVHSTLEEAVVYPKIEQKQDKTTADTMRAEHQPVKNELYEIDQIGYVTDPKIMPKLQSVMQNLRDHISHEEEQEIPRLESLLSTDEMQTLVNMWNTMRPTIPTRPHPSAPDKPPGNIAASAIATPMDKMKDLVRSYVEVDKS